MRAAVAIVCVLLVVLLLSTLLVRTRQHEEVCFVVDMLRSKVPHPTPPPPNPQSRPPMAFGAICFNEMQELVQWDFTDTFQNVYRTSLIDQRLHGPLVGNDTVAPVVLAMGLSRQGKKLAGSSIITVTLLTKIVQSPESFYTALYVTDSQGTSEIEVARSTLARSLAQH